MPNAWKRIDEEVPKEGQEVFYYFGVFNRVFAGRYLGQTETAKHCFASKHGWLGDDVTYWMPRVASSVTPKVPSYKQRKADLYHPLKDNA